MKCGCGNDLVLGEIHILHEMDDLAACQECHKKYQAIRDKHFGEVQRGFGLWQKATRAMKEKPVWDIDPQGKGAVLISGEPPLGYILEVAMEKQPNSFCQGCENLGIDNLCECELGLVECCRTIQLSPQAE